MKQCKDVKIFNSEKNFPVILDFNVLQKCVYYAKNMCIMCYLARGI